MIDQQRIDELLMQAGESPRLRQNLDLRTRPEDPGQCMLNALLSGTEVPIHRHPISNENVVCIYGKLWEIFYDEEGRETERFCLCPREGRYGLTVPEGTWHTIEVVEPSVIIEAKHGRYGDDGTETRPPSFPPRGED